MDKLGTKIILETYIVYSLYHNYVVVFVVFVEYDIVHKRRQYLYPNYLGTYVFQSILATYVHAEAMPLPRSNSVI